MGFHDQERSSTPKLALFSFPINRAAEPPGMATPPVNAAGSVPFEWEEAPGKPRASSTEANPSGVVRCLELPPRLLLPTEAAKITSVPSPTTVLDGPYVVQYLSTSRSVSFRKVGGPSFKEKSLFGSSRWGSFSKNREVVEGSFDFSSWSDGRPGGGGGEDRDGGGTKVKITRIRRKGSFLSQSQTKTHLWASIYEGLKQVIPWRRRQEKMRRMSSSAS